MTLRELFAVVGFDVDFDTLRRLNQELDAVKQLTRETFSGLSEIARGIRNIGLGLTAGLTVPITLAGAASVKTEAQVESLLVRYKVLLGEAAKAKGYFNDLVTLDRQTPGMGLFDVLGYGDKMLMMKMSPEESLKRIRQFAAASATGTDMSWAMNTLMQQMYQVYNKGRADITDFKPIANAGLDIYGALKEAGRTGEATGATFEEMIRAIEILANRGKDLLGERSEAKVGLWEQLQSVIFELRLEIGRILNETLPLREWLKGLIKGLEGIVKWLKEMPTWLKYVTVGFTLLVAAIGPLLAMTGQISLFVLQILGLKLALGMLGVSITGIVASIGSFVAAAAPWIAAIGAIVLAIEDLYVWIKGGDSVIGDWLGPWNDWLTEVKRIIEDAKQAVLSLYEVVMSQFSLDNWKNLGKELFDLKNSGAIAKPVFNVAEFLTNPFGTAARATFGKVFTFNPINTVHVTVQGDADESRIQTTKNAVADTLMDATEFQRQLSAAHFSLGD